jgi:prepilin-type N-terminal cleavage/methylation domain-containing protein
MKRFVKDEKGFTLVELAIVLVIIGIILGGVIKGQELITSAKMKKIPGIAQEITAAINGYQDRYRYMPGDDNTAVSRWAGVYTPAAATQANSQINGANANANSPVATVLACGAAGLNTESCGAWEHMRQAGLISGSGRTNPLHAFGGNLGVGYYTGAGAAMPTRAGNWLVFQNVPAQICEQVDSQFDDGTRTPAAAGWNSGTVQTSANWSTAANPDTPLTLFWKL